MSSYNAWDITKASYCNVFSDIRGFINAAWRWIVLFLAFTVLGSFFAGLLNLPILSSASVIIWIVASIAFEQDFEYIDSGGDPASRIIAAIPVELSLAGLSLITAVVD